MAVADRVAVMRDGAIEQIDPPRVLYGRPASAFVASFVGTVNRLSATRAENGTWLVLGAPVEVAGGPFAPDHAVQAVVRPEQVEVRPAVSDGGLSPRVVGLAFLGAFTRASIDHPHEGVITADLLGDAANALTIGDAVTVSVRRSAGAVVLQ